MLKIVQKIVHINFFLILRFFLKVKNNSPSIIGQKRSNHSFKRSMSRFIKTRIVDIRRPNKIVSISFRIERYNKSDFHALTFTLFAILIAILEISYVGNAKS